ncbi:DUF4136 domain-containing protein [Nibribacter ruber]|uniref:DUF4136 domain-containing protein n=1 Tax=Nibribacter ruber TaxID=2698458 RepID=A0A6P1NVR3_9BACT|nr:DUF4136 domain-containing protein [Nibribacter ruber]QHL86068.1 DUF4136 domain-containing protein [Nibribacter ruber]
MRKTYGIQVLLILPLALLLSGCMIFGKQKYGSDYSYSGMFNKYKTFNFITHASNEDTATLKNYEVLRKFIRERLEIQGYTYTEKKPDLLVSYFIFFDDLNMKGYEQEEFDVWLAENADNGEGVKSKDPYKPIKIYMSQGTLMVTLLDQKRQNAVWQGYTSGVLADKNAESTVYLNRAVRTIFDQYRVFRQGYLRESYNHN